MVDQPSQRKVFRIDVHNTNFTVRNPRVSSGHIVYQVEGEDKEGKFEGARRFNDFYELNQAIAKRWPGVYLPSVPPKKSFVRRRCLTSEQQRY